MKLWRRCVDDRGKAWRPQAESFDRMVLEAGGNPRSLFDAGDIAYSRAAMVFAAYLPAGMGYLAVLWALGGQVAEWVKWGLLAVFGLLGVFTERALSRLRTAQAQRQAGMMMGLCPACGYPLAELEPEADGCRVCPECGSAWKMDEGAAHAKA